MASEDVIELGSSDDETEPAPKKSKPMPNAMVCIPRKLHEVTIKPAKLNLATNRGPNKGGPAIKGIQTAKGATTSKPTGRMVAPVIKPSNFKANPFASKSKANGKPTQKVALIPNIKIVKPVTIQKPSNKDNLFSMLPKQPNVGSTSYLKNPIRIQTPKSLNNLPASITVKRTTQPVKKPIIFVNPPNLTNKKAKLAKSQQVIVVPTVELDDDEGSPQTSSPAWYIRPEEQTEDPNPEQENNKEPETPKMIEITIEDSPIKPVPNKRTCEIGAELSITIDDSPVKITGDKNASLSGSDHEASSPKVPNSKKKLEYPKENRNTVEIEIDIPLESSVDPNTDASNKKLHYEDVSITNVEISVEPSKKTDTTESSTQNEINTSKENKVAIPSSSVESEFHPIYQNFIDVCFQLENTDDMKKIVEKKIKSYYRQVPKEYAESEEFIDMVASKVVAMKASPDKMYLYIKDIVDELNMQRKLAKSQIVEKVAVSEEPEQFTFGEESEYDLKRQRQIRKLEKTIKKLHRAIQKLEEQEVDFDDDDDSVYLLTERYKERMVRVYAKFCQLTNTKMPSEPRIVIDARPGQPSGPAKRLEKWINKKVPIGTPLPFPDFHDVLRCVRDANDEDKLCWNEVDIMEEARDLFMRCGKKLQRRRQENEWRLAASRIALETDPAENNEQLKCKLDENKKIAANKETEIFNKYADRQKQLKLEAVEIGDKEAEESPVESEEEETNDESVSLENTDKRKERLKRLLQERAKRASEGKENQPTDEPNIIEKEAKKSEGNEEVVTIKEKEANAEEKKEDSNKVLEESQNPKHSDNPTETLSVSSEATSDLESDVDELHLLQKLHSGNEARTSTLESSDSESPIAISDSLESCESDNESKKQQSDVISIENSSYSESEVEKIDTIPPKNTKDDKLVAADCGPNVKTAAIVNADKEIASNDVIETENSNPVLETECLSPSTRNVHSNNNEYSESVENILLASSDEENDNTQKEKCSTDGACINLRDDLISIDETIVGSIVDKLGSKEDESSEVNIDIQAKDDNKLKETSNDTESIDTTLKEAPSATEKESVQTTITSVSDRKSPEAVESMDVDEYVENTETLEISVERSLTLSSETQ